MMLCDNRTSTKDHQNDAGMLHVVCAVQQETPRITVTLRVVGDQRFLNLKNVVNGCVKEVRSGRGDLKSHPVSPVSSLFTLSDAAYNHLKCVHNKNKERNNIITTNTNITPRNRGYFKRHNTATLSAPIISLPLSQRASPSTFEVLTECAPPPFVGRWCPQHLVFHAVTSERPIVCLCN